MYLRALNQSMATFFHGVTFVVFEVVCGVEFYSFVAERFKIHSLWPRRSRGFKL